MLTKEDAEDIMKVEGKARGVCFQVDVEYIKKIGGKEGMNKVKKELQKLGYPIEYEKIKATEWRPLRLRILSLLVIKDVLNLSDEDIKTMGDIAPKFSLIAKLFMKALMSPQLAISDVPKYWKKHYTVGEVDVEELNLEKKYMIVCVKDFKLHPVHCKYLEGYFGRLTKFLFPDEKVKAKETKCMFKGDAYHEYKVYWEEESER